MIELEVTYPWGAKKMLPYTEARYMSIIRNEDGSVEYKVLDRATSNPAYNAIVMSLHNWANARKFFGKVVEYTPFYYTYEVDGRVVEERYVTKDWAF